MTRAKGWFGWVKSASEWTGCRGLLELGIETAVFPEQNLHCGVGPRIAVVICVAILSIERKLFHRNSTQKTRKRWGVAYS